jgi:hypothetical protein
MHVDESVVTLSNCIFRWNEAQYGEELFIAQSSTLTIDHCCIQSGEPYIDDVDNGIVWGLGNIDLNPEFIDHDGIDGIVGTEDDNLRLSVSSPCIDTGNNTAVPSWYTADLDGFQRIINSVVDMGAYEFKPAPIAYNLTINIVGSGQVAKIPDQVTYNYNDVVELTAVPDSGWTFSQWSGNLTGSGNPETITMDGNKTITATFTQSQNTLIINIVGNGTVTKDPDKATYDYNDVVELTAVPDPIWVFSHWSGNLTGSASPESVTMDGDKIVTANFALRAEIDFAPDTLNFNSNGKFVTAYIELPEGWDVADINISTVMLNKLVQALLSPTDISDYNNNGVPDLMIKFLRPEVQSIITSDDEAEVSINGEINGVYFEGSDSIRVVHGG